MYNVSHSCSLILYRLSELAGARLKDNNPAIADLSDQNRPSKMSERYSELYDNEWTDVMEAVKTKTEKQNKKNKDKTNEEDQEVEVIHFLRDSLIVRTLLHPLFIPIISYSTYS